MKYDALKNNVDRLVRIRPALQRYDSTAALEVTLEDSWRLTEVTPEGAKLRNLSTDHTKVLGLDHIHHYMEDPDSARTGGPNGVLVLNVQLLFFNGELLAEPVAPPGSSLKAFVPAQRREDFFSVAKRYQSQNKFAHLKKAYATSTAGIGASDEAFYEIFSAVASIEAILQDQGNTSEIVRKHIGLNILIGAFGWWASVIWERYQNTLDNSRLTIRKWDGHPPFPNVLLLRKPNCVAVKQYTFGLVDSGIAKWLDLNNVQHFVSSKEIVMDILQDFMSNPLDPAIPWFE